MVAPWPHLTTAATHSNCPQRHSHRIPQNEQRQHTSCQLSSPRHTHTHITQTAFATDHNSAKAHASGAVSCSAHWRAVHAVRSDDKRFLTTPHPGLCTLTIGGQRGMEAHPRTASVTQQPPTHTNRQWCCKVRAGTAILRGH